MIRLLRERIVRIERDEQHHLHLFASEDWAAAPDGAEEAPWLVLESGEPFVALRARRPSEQGEVQTPFRGMLAVGPKEITEAELTKRLDAIAQLLTPKGLNRINLQMRKHGATVPVWDAIFEIRFINNYSIFGQMEVPS